MTYQARPADVLRELVTLLRGHRIDRLYWSACAVVGVLSVAPGVTVWTDGRTLTCLLNGVSRDWPAAATDHAAAELAALAQSPTPPPLPCTPKYR